MERQRGIGLIQVAIVMAALAAVAMAALMSMRQERNLFADALARLRGQTVEHQQQQQQRAPAPAGVLRKCLIDGKTVLSDVECTAANPSSRVVKPLDTRGIEPPRQPKAEPAEAGPPSMQDKMIEKATR
ncbi:MAG: DUF4124 domain-containing protein [Pseudomonadota bacterium]